MPDVLRGDDWLSGRQHKNEHDQGNINHDFDQMPELQENLRVNSTVKSH